MKFYHGTSIENAKQILTEGFVLGKKKTYGVYLANKGYTQFVQVKMLYRNDQYSIIEPVNDNELRLYDRVVLKAKGVKDGQMLNDD